MGGPNDLLFGRIALEKGFVTEADVQDCVAEQAAIHDPRPLGELLLARGTITRRQMEAVLAVQKERLAAEAPGTRQRREDTLFGRLAWRLGMLTQEDLNACLRTQASQEERGEKGCALGEMLVREGYLTDRQVHSILEFQRKAILYCAACRVLYSLKGLLPRGAAEPQHPSHCPRCQGALHPPADEVPAEVEWVDLPLEGLPVRSPSTISPTPIAPRHPTRRVPSDPESRPAVAASAAPPGPPSPTVPAPAEPPGPAALAGGDAPEPSAPAPTDPASPGAPVAGPNCTCPVCNHAFHAESDRFGRVRCPECRTHFLG